MMTPKCRTNRFVFGLCATIIASFALTTNVVHATDPSPSQIQRITATIASTASLVISEPTVTFPATNPDATGGMLIPANENVSTGTMITASAQVNSGQTVTLTVVPDAVLLGGTAPDTIPIGAVSFTTVGDGSGGWDSQTLNASGVIVGSWTDSGVRTGYINYYLANSWDYKVDTYTALLTYTLAAV